MKNKFHIFPVMLLIVLALVMGATPVQAAAKSTVMKKADAATKDVTNTANYYGREWA